MDLEKIKNYKIDESTVLSNTDKKHLENYKQLIKFFESAIQESISNGKADYNVLHNSCMQCIRHLDSLLYSYNSSIQNVRMLNKTLDAIVNIDKEEAVGNSQEVQETQ